MIESIANSLDALFDTLGILGMCAILLAYFMMQQGTWSSHKPPYLYTNLLGASCLLASLLWSWNLASFVLELAWITITLYGLMKYYRNANRQEPL